MSERFQWIEGVGGKAEIVHALTKGMRPLAVTLRVMSDGLVEVTHFQGASAGMSIDFGSPDVLNLPQEIVLLHDNFNGKEPLTLTLKDGTYAAYQVLAIGPG